MLVLLNKVIRLNLHKVYSMYEPNFIYFKADIVHICKPRLSGEFW